MKPHDFTCPVCGAGPLAPCDDPDGYTHRERAEAWSAAQPRPEPEPELPPNRGGGKQVKIA